ncbi:MAG: tRNA (guanine(46)-N(7))-methyltransferase TrmB [Methyloligellaceae bacterium]
MTERSEENAGRIYGRRKGHRLSPRQQQLIADDLPALRLDVARPAPQPLRVLFSPPVRDVWLEIGFGAGEHLAWQANAHAEVGVIGCEPFVNGVAKLLVQITERGLRNVRIFDEEVHALLSWLPECSLGRIFVLFPDPWPKKRHHKRRLLSPPTLDALARLMRPGAELRVATDIGDYARFTLISARRAGHFTWMATRAADWRERPADWPETRYERKAAREGRRACYLRFVRV